jgi:hypothetical protein
MNVYEYKTTVHFLCERSFELNETCNQRGYTPSINVGQDSYRRTIKPKKKEIKKGREGLKISTKAETERNR